MEGESETPCPRDEQQAGAPTARSLRVGEAASPPQSEQTSAVDRDQRSEACKPAQVEGEKRNRSWTGAAAETKRTQARKGGVLAGVFLGAL